MPDQKTGLGAQIWSWIKDQLEYLDAIIILLGGATVFVLGIAGVLSGEHLTEALVALITLFALTVLRDRKSREESNTAIAALEQSFTDTAAELTRDVQTGLAELTVAVEN